MSSPGALTARVVLMCLASGTIAAPRVTHLPDEPLRFQRLLLPSGISDLTINAIVQDSQGYLWIGTRNGLNRYDGVTFRIFQHDPRDSTSLPHDNISSLFVDPRGRLWVGTISSLCVYDPSRHSFRRNLSDDGAPPAFFPFDVVTIAEDAEGVLWLGSWENGVSQFQPATGTLAKRIPVTGQTGTGRRVNALAFERTGGLWIASIDSGVMRYDPGNGRLKRYRHPAGPGSVPSDHATAVACAPDGSVWVGTPDAGLGRLNQQTDRWEVFPAGPPGSSTAISAEAVWRIVVDNRGLVWIGTQGGGVDMFDPRTARFVHNQRREFDETSISDNYANAIAQDRGGVVWIGTGSGLNKIVPNSRVFRHVFNPSGQVPVLGSNGVSALLKDARGIIWVGDRTGLTRIDDSARISRHADLTVHGSVVGVTSLRESRDGTLWAGTAGAGLVEVSRAEPGSIRYGPRWFRHHPGDSTSLSHDFVYSVWEDAAGALWIGTEHGLNRWIASTGSFHRYYSDDHDSSTLSSDIVMNIRDDGSGGLWICTMNGLNSVDVHTGRVRRYTPSSRDTTSISSSAVFGIAPDRFGRFWCATARGLSMYDPVLGAFRSYYTVHGLPDVFLKSIVRDSQGTLWVSARSGIASIEPRQEGPLIRSYDQRDGLPGVDFNPTCGDTGPDGEILFGGDVGFTRFYPGAFAAPPPPPPVVITAVHLFDREVVPAGALVLPHTEYTFSIEFAALDFAAPEKHQYRCMLEGLDAHWLAGGKGRSARYGKLPAGEYTFRVQAAGAGGVWGPGTASLAIVILPPYWETWWFRLIIVLALAGTLGLAYHYRVRKLLEVERLRTRIASDLHDDVGSSLTRIAVEAQLLQEGLDPANAGSRLAHIASRSAEVIGSMSDIVWSIDARNDSAGSLISRMRDFASGLFNDGQVTVRFLVDGIDPERITRPEQRQNVYLIYKEALNNAARHSRATEIVVALTDADGSFRMSIHDNGIGFDGRARESGHGVRNMRMRAERMQARLEIDGSNGTTITLMLSH